MNDVLRLNLYNKNIKLGAQNVHNSLEILIIKVNELTYTEAKTIIVTNGNFNILLFEHNKNCFELKQKDEDLETFY